MLLLRSIPISMQIILELLLLVFVVIFLQAGAWFTHMQNNTKQKYFSFYFASVDIVYFLPGI